MEKTGHTEVIKELLASEDPKVDVTLVDNKKLTALMLADKNGHDEVVKLFTDEKYDKNIQQAGQLEKKSPGVTSKDEINFDVSANVLVSQYNKKGFLPKSEKTEEIEALVLSKL